jgi:Ca2+-binding RTX toxin-like protein
MNPTNSILRVALGTALAGAAISAVPALASASPCTYDPVHKAATVVDSSGVSQLRVGVNGNQIFTQDGGNPPANCAGGGTLATTTNTDRINVFSQAKGASDGVVLDQSKGVFAPGATPEDADGNSEIELALNGQSGHLTVIGTPGDDIMRVGNGSRAPGTGDIGFGPDADEDVTFAASDVTLAGGEGNDLLSGQGLVPPDPILNNIAAAARLPIGFSGGAGDDRIFGGAGVDHFAGNAGNDTLDTADGQPELVSGGPGSDSDVRDGGDTLFDVETSVLGVGRSELAPRTVTADARKWARMTLRWTHPKSWRELRKLEVKLYRGDKRIGTIDARPHSRRLTSRGVEIMANRSLLTHSRKTVTARLGMKFPRSLAGASLRVAVEATDVHGHSQLERDAGLIRVAGAAFAALPLPQTCAKDGVCFTKARNGARTTITVTGTAGDDNIVISNIPPFGNNNGPTLGVDGKNTIVSDNAFLDVVVDAGAGNDHVTNQLTSVNPLYGTFRVDGGSGNDVLVGANRADVLIGGAGADVLDGQAGDDQLLAADGQADTLRGGPGADSAQHDAIDALDGVEADSPVVGRARMTERAVHTRAGRTTRLGLAWTHPQSWRRLKMINLHAFDGGREVGEVYVPMHGAARGSGDLSLVSSRLTHHAKTARTRLAVRLPRSLSGKTLRLDLEAADRDGHLQIVSGVGELKVAR